MFNTLQTFLQNHIQFEHLIKFSKAALILLLGILFTSLIRKSVRKAFSSQLDKNQIYITDKALKYSLYLIIFSIVLHEVGFSLSVLLGTAGIITVALGFASQTSVSNVISGLFLIGEKTFSPGDIIQVDDITGEVLAIDLLSIKLRTFDNLMVRIPNEKILKSNLINMSSFPIRRLDIKISIALQENIEMVKTLLFEVAEKDQLCLEEPKPLFIFLGFGEYSLNIQFSVWAEKSNYIPLQNKIHQEIKEAFDKNGIEIPYPHRKVIYTEQTA